MSSAQPLKILQLIYKPDHLLPLFNTYAKALMHAGHEVTTVFLTGSKDNTVIVATLANHVEFCCFSTKQLKTNKFKVSRKIRRLWLKDQFDLAICHRHKPSFVFSLARLGLKQAPMLSVVHALDQYKRNNRRLHARMMYTSNQNKTCIIAVSEAVNSNIEQAFHNNSPCSILTIPNIIDIDKIVSCQLKRVAAREQLGFGLDELVIGTVARLVSGKAHHDLLAAFSEIINSENQLTVKTKLVIVGAGKLETQLKQQARLLDITPFVVFAGDIKNASRLMTAFDLFVLSSTVESFGLVLLEAMAAKLPIVATSVGSIPSIVGNHVQCVSPANPQQLARAIDSMLQLDSNRRRELGELGYKHLLYNFNEKQFKQKLSAAINQIIC